MYIKHTNKVLARYLLATHKQQGVVTSDQFLQAVKTLSKYCNFQNVNGAVYRDEAIHDAFIMGLESNIIPQRVMESYNSLDLDTMFSQVRSLDAAQKSSESYFLPGPPPLPTASMVSSFLFVSDPQINYENTASMG